MRPTLSHALRTAAPDRSDGQLLDLFAKHRDEEAFAAVVRRHGPMVLGVCRRLLGNPADADDAFQTTFLVLARRAATLGRVEALAGWLHAVAVNAARKLRHMNARRTARERRAAGPPVPPPADDLVRDELLAALDDEIARLPAIYRDVVVLCELEGVTRKEAARRLGCPEGTVAGRLARARARLAARLADRGLAYAGLAGLTITVPPTLAASALEAATAGPTSARVAAATEGVMKAMLLNRIRAATAALLIGAVALTGVGVSRGPAEDQPAAPPAAKAPEPAKPGERRVTVFPLKKVKVAEAVAVLRETLAATDGKPPEPLPAWFAMLDADKDGSVSLGEWQQAGRTAEQFAAMDLNGDGVLTADEWRRFRKQERSEPGGAIRAGSATLIPVEADNTLLVYADEPTTREVEAMLRKLGEPPPKVAARIPLTNVPAAEAAKVLSEVFGPGRVTIAPAPAEDALIVYATDADLRTIRRLLNQALDAPAAKPGGAPVATRLHIPLKNARAADVAAALRKQYPALKVFVTLHAAGDSSLVIEADPATLAQIEDVVRKLDAPPPEGWEKLNADVELLKERVAFAEQMVERGYMSQAELRAARDQLRAAEAKLKGRE